MGGFATVTARDADSTANGLGHLLPLMRAKGVTVGAREFQEAVNLVFHDFESSVYDRIHRDLRESLPRHFNALIEDWLRVSETRGAIGYSTSAAAPERAPNFCSPPPSGSGSST